MDGDKSTHEHMTDDVTVSPAGEFCILTKTSHFNIRSETDVRQDSSLKPKD